MKTIAPHDCANSEVHHVTKCLRTHTVSPDSQPWSRVEILPSKSRHMHACFKRFFTRVSRVCHACRSHATGLISLSCTVCYCSASETGLNQKILFMCMKIWVGISNGNYGDQVSKTCCCEKNTLYVLCGALDNLCAGNAVCRNRTQGHKPDKKQILHQRY